MLQYVGNMHGDEPLGRELVLLLADWLCDNYPKDSMVRILYLLWTCWILCALGSWCLVVKIFCFFSLTTVQHTAEGLVLHSLYFWFDIHIKWNKISGRTLHNLKE